jgi:hypothetical protein
VPLARTYSVALVGVTGHVVEVEVDIANGLVGMILVGLPDTALREARDRIRAAMVNSGEVWPQRKITVGLSPASLPKRGSWFDLAIAVAVLTAAGKVPRAAVDRLIFFGELGLDGRLRPVRGVLPAVAAAADNGFGTVMVAEQNASEAALVPGVQIIAASSLTAAVDWLRGTPGLRSLPAARLEGGRERPDGREARGHHGGPEGAMALTSPRCSASRWPGERQRSGARRASCARRRRSVNDRGRGGRRPRHRTALPGPAGCLRLYRALRPRLAAAQALTVTTRRRKCRKPRPHGLRGQRTRVRRNVPVCSVAWAASGVPSMSG